ncbi:MAG TPA: MFS transporter [Frankiaceae bacterium]|nr:MFS transporter [Frankiaceae bacterium]
MVTGQRRWAPSWLHRNLLVLCGVSFLQDAASELVYPLLPLLLTGPLAAPAVVVGAIEGIAEGASAVTKLLAGRLADLHRRAPLVAVGYGLAALGKALVAAALVWPVVLAGRVVDRLGKGVRGTPRDALLVVGIPADRRGAAFGLHRAADTAGAVVGPLLGLAAYELVGLRGALVVAVVPAVLSVLLVGVLREGPPPSSRLEPRPRRRPGPPPRRAAPATPAVAPLPAPLRRVLALLTVFAVVNVPDALLLLRAHEVGFGVAGVLGVYVAYNAVYALLSFPAGALSDRLPRRYVMAAGLLVFAVAYAGLGLVDSRPGVVALFLLYGGYTASTDGVGKAWVSALAPAIRQGFAQGLYQGLSGAGALVAGLWAGVLWSGDGRLPLVLAGAVAATVAVALLVARPG